MRLIFISGHLKVEPIGKRVSKIMVILIKSVYPGKRKIPDTSGRLDKKFRRKDFFGNF
jgi:hypothetical protein